AAARAGRGRSARRLEDEAAFAAAGAGDVLSTLEVWDAHLARIGAELLAARLDLVEALRPLVAKAYAALAPSSGTADLRYRSSLSTIGGQATLSTGGGPFAQSTGGGRFAQSTGGGRSTESTDGGRCARPRADGRASGPAVPGPEDVPEAGPADRAALAAALREALLAARPAELERGVNLVGPHRDDLELRLGDLPARGYASHGESWSFALALRLAAYEL